MSNDNEDVGYGKPPKEHRFQQGASGNPRGRPKGSANINTALLKAVRETVVVNENGRRKSMRKLEAFWKQIINSAISGNVAAARLLVQQMQRLEGQSDQQTRPQAHDERDQEVMNSLIERFTSMSLEEKK